MQFKNSLVRKDSDKVLNVANKSEIAEFLSEARKSLENYLLSHKHLNDNAGTIRALMECIRDLNELQSQKLADAMKASPPGSHAPHAAGAVSTSTSSVVSPHLPDGFSKDPEGNSSYEKISDVYKKATWEHHKEELSKKDAPLYCLEERDAHMLFSFKQGDKIVHEVVNKPFQANLIDLVHGELNKKFPEIKSRTFIDEAGLQSLREERASNLRLIDSFITQLKEQPIEKVVEVYKQLADPNSMFKQLHRNKDLLLATLKSHMEDFEKNKPIPRA